MWVQDVPAEVIAMRATCVLVVTLWLSAPTFGNDNDEKQQVTEIVNALSDCGGFYDYLAEVADRIDKPSAAQSFRDAARGARLSAAYVFSLESAARGNPRALADFSEYVANRSSLSLTQIKGLDEIEDSEGIQRIGEKCRASLELQRTLVQEIRDQLLDR